MITLLQQQQQWQQQLLVPVAFFLELALVKTSRSLARSLD
jgi:hypothetical protein